MVGRPKEAWPNSWPTRSWVEFQPVTVFSTRTRQSGNELENLIVCPLSFGGGDKSSKTVLKINRWGRVVDIYRNVAEAAKKNHISKSAIRERCLNMVSDPFRLDGHNYQYESEWTGRGKRRKVEG